MGSIWEWGQFWDLVSSRLFTLGIVTVWSHRGPPALFDFLGINLFKCSALLENKTKAMLAVQFKGDLAASVCISKAALK